MRAVSKLAVSVTALGAALVATGASAQVVSRSISEEPVETTVTQTPNATVVTRRPVGAGPVYQAPPVGVVAPPPYAAPAVVEAVPDTVDAITTRQVVRRVERPVSLPTRATRVRKVVRPANRAVVTRTARTFRRPVAVALSPAERHIIFQTIVERRIIPAPPVVGPAFGPPPVVAAGPVIAPPPIVTGPPPVVAAAPPPVLTTAPVLARDEEGDDFVTEPVYAVGSVLPRNVPLYAVPQDVAYRVPAARPYSYAYLGGRAYLVDPASGTIVADVTE